MSRITPGTMIVLIFAVLFGLVGAYAVRRHLAQNQPVAPPPRAAVVPPEPLLTIPLASTDLKPGRELKLGDIALVRMTRAQMKKLDVPNEAMSNPQQIIGRVLHDEMKKGQAFVSTALYPEGTGPSISERLSQGLRAVTIPVHGTGVLSGLTTVGSRVDVLFRTNEAPTKEIPEATFTLLEGVEVLAVQENISPGVKNPNTVANVTLAVTTSQANALKIAEGRGEFSLSLRSDKDDAMAARSGPQTLEALLNIQKRRPPQQIEVYRGVSRSVITFDGGRVRDEFQNVAPVGGNFQPANPPQQNPNALPKNVEQLLPKDLN